MINLTKNSNKPTRIVIFEHYDSGQEKIKGINEFGRNIEIVQIVNLEMTLPGFIDEPEEFIPDIVDCDLVLCFIKHPDIIYYIAKICQESTVPLIASGSKCENAITPFTCCGLGRLKNLGNYGDQFGLPEFEVKIKDNIITAITVQRGASCGATWRAARTIIGMSPEEAFPTLAREVQYLCVANPSAFDPISGRSSLHYAGNVHIKALKKALKKIPN